MLLLSRLLLNLNLLSMSVPSLTPKLSSRTFAALPGRRYSQSWHCWTPFVAKWRTMQNGCGMLAGAMKVNSGRPPREHV